jgi:DNA primase
VKAPPSLAAIVGLTRKRKNGDGSYDIFRNRLMFSIQNHKGEFVGFGGRALADADQPKYLNSPESDIFQKGHTFYGLNESAPFIRQVQAAIVVEGYMDFLALFGAGIKNVVATLGTAMTPAHAQLLKRYAKNVIILFDGDEAGQRAAQRSLPILLNAGVVPKGLTLPNELDPDEFLKAKGTKELKNLIEHAPELFQLQLDRLLMTFKGTPSEKVALLDRLGPIFENISDLRLKELYSAEVAQRISVDSQWVAKNLPKNKHLAQNRPPITLKEPKHVIQEGPKIKLLAAPKAELFLLNIALMSPEDFALIWGAEVVEKMTHPGVQEMLVMANEFYRQNPSEFAKLTAYLMTKTSTPHEVALHLGEPLRSIGAEEKAKMTADCLKQIEDKFARLKTREITAKMRRISTVEQLKELEQIVNIRKGTRKPKKTE